MIRRTRGGTQQDEDFLDLLQTPQQFSLNSTIFKPKKTCLNKCTCFLVSTNLLNYMLLQILNFLNLLDFENFNFQQLMSYQVRMFTQLLIVYSDSHHTLIQQNRKITEPLNPRFFLAVQSSSIGDLVTESVIVEIIFRYFELF